MMIGNETPIGEIMSIDVERPEAAGSKWMGVRHGDLINGIEQQLQYRNINTTEKHFSVDESGASLIGYFNITSDDLPTIDGQKYMLGVRHSNDMRHPITLSIGTTITICHNGVITGEYILRRKHTKNLDLEQELFGAIRTVSEMLPRVSVGINMLRETPLDDYERVLVSGARNRLYPWSWIGKIDSEYRNPSENNPECIDFHGTKWGVYNAFNYIMREATPERQASSLYKFASLMS